MHRGRGVPDLVADLDPLRLAAAEAHRSAEVEAAGAELAPFMVAMEEPGADRDALLDESAGAAARLDEAIRQRDAVRELRAVRASWERARASWFAAALVAELRRFVATRLVVRDLPVGTQRGTRRQTGRRVSAARGSDPPLPELALDWKGLSARWERQYVRSGGRHD
jgi:hypothetical protein